MQINRSTLELQVDGPDHKTLHVSPDRLTIAGFTGRDPAALKAHIDELAAIGVPAPSTVPEFYILPPSLLTTEAVVEVDSAATSGEVEPVLIRHAGRYYLGVGSDHTDRQLERRDIRASKAACPKPLGGFVLPLPNDLGDVAWDDISVAMWVDGQLYQRACLDTLRPLPELLKYLEGEIGVLAGDVVLYGGTVPLVTEGVQAGTEWRLELSLSPTCRLQHAYVAVTVPSHPERGRFTR